MPVIERDDPYAPVGPPFFKAPEDEIRVMRQERKRWMDRALRAERALGVIESATRTALHDYREPLDVR